MGFSATYALTQTEGESSTTNITGAGRFVGPDDADLTIHGRGRVVASPSTSRSCEPKASDTSPSTTRGLQGGAGSVLPGVTGSLLDGLRTIIELDTLASELELRGGGAELWLEVVVTDGNAGLGVTHR